MRLTNLTIKGFKSFANETILNFDENVIGVVGPNGSGKSNIVDAIRWVLGEQKSKELRLEKMTDILFNGTKSKKASGAASVSLTFSNTKNILPTEYNTVTISRHLYNTGESEYKLNNVTCRLKDITSLLLDTGIGSNSYAIIALGMVDDILEDKGNARRMMFEQAAGISKYKVRKRETLGKLASTEADLDRIQDILFELENNLKSIEKQARKAKKYFEIKDEYKDLSIQSAKRSIINLRKDQKSIQDAIEAGIQELTGLQADQTTVESNIQEFKKKHLDKEVYLSKAQKKLNEVLYGIREKENEKNIIHEKVSFANQRLTEINSIQERNLLKLSESKNQLETLSTGLRIVGVTREKERGALQLAEEKYEKEKREFEDIRSKYENLAKRQEELEQKLYQSEKQYAIIENQLANSSKDKTYINSEMESLKQNDQDIIGSLQRLEKEIFKLNEQVKVIDQENIEKEKTISTLVTQKQTLKDKLIELNRKLDSSNNEASLLKNMIDSLEGYPNSIKYLHSHWKHKAVVLTDIISVPNDLKGVLEHFLEPYLNYFVVENIDAASDAIRTLNHAQQGKANFFLLDKFNDKAETISIDLINTTPLISMIDCEPKYQRLLSYLLKGVYVFDGRLEELKHNLEYEQYIFLAKDGSFVKQSNTVGGGSVGLFEGSRIGRKNQLEQLHKNINIIAAEKQKLENEIHQLSEKTEILKTKDTLHNLKELTSELGQKNREQVQLTTRKQALDHQLSQLQNRLQDNLNQEITFKAELTGVTSYIDDVKQELASFQGTIQVDKGDFQQYSQKLSESSNLLNTKKIEVMKIDNEYNNLVKDQEYIQLRIKEIEELLKSNELSHENFKKQIQDYKKALEALDSALTEQYAIRKDEEGHLTQAEHDYFAGRTVINDYEEKMRILNKKISESQTKVNRTKDQLTEIRLKVNGFFDRLQIEFEVSEKALMDYVIDEGMGFEELTIKVQRLKARLENYGDINPLAMEAFAEMQERYDMILKQRDDIIEAKASLLETIKEIESTATQKFMEAFESVRVNFKDVFRSLFTDDDDCDLILMDSESPLEANIEIIAKPKGKRPKSLSQLSGGEKTLTATALLFALYLLKPAPFCIFDEVDAPLDDSNIQKFNKIIKKFSKDSQFIIVTHNKLTMAEVDVLYGVYMQEQGISSVSAVDFRKFRHDSTLEVLSN